MLTYDYCQDVENVTVNSMEVITFMVKEHSVNRIMNENGDMIFANLNLFYDYVRLFFTDFRKLKAN